MKLALAVVALSSLAFAADLEPPKPPENGKKALESASAVAVDVSARMAYLEQGQTYYKAFTHGSHTTAQNKDFVRFAEDYDRELQTVKQEVEILRVWIDKKSELKPE